MPRYCIGIDFGTLSARALLVETDSGREIASGVCDYPHGVMESALPTGEKLGLGFALQHPGDYLFALEHSVKRALAAAPGCARQVIALALDVTASTLLPVKADGMPLCLTDRFARNPYAYAMLWMHAGPQAFADRMSELAREMDEERLALLGGRVDAQWTLPKLYQVLEEAPEVYRAADYFIEAGDWLVWRLCGRMGRSASMAGYKAMYAKGKGFPADDYFRALDPRLEGVMRDKLAGEVLPIGQRAGGLRGDMAALLGLPEGIPVAVSLIDAHTSVAGCGVTQAGTMVYIAGTSGCHLMLGERLVPVPGICGVVEDGMIPGFYGYEAGQNCVGEAFGWAAEQLTPAAYHGQAARRGIDIHQYLTELAAELAPGECGLLALDFWRGNRSILADSDLSGMILGLTPRTRSEHIYRALLEAAAFGTRVIIDNYRDHGLPVEGFVVTGGISKKNPLLMQILADVCQMPVRVPETRYSGALGSAVFAAAAAGRAAGGWESVAEAAQRMGSKTERVYEPNGRNSAVYSTLYGEYQRLYDSFGRGGNKAMKTLGALRRAAVR